MLKKLIAELSSGFLGAQTVLKTDLVPGKGTITNEEAVLNHSDAKILVNTTPCGMFPKLSGMAVDPADFPNLEGAIDVVYNPLRTDFVQRAQSLGIPAAAGLYMLVMQAILAAQSREAAGFTAPSRGLCLEEVFYEEWEGRKEK